MRGLLRAAAAGVVSAAVALSGCAPAQAEERPLTLVLGDSITHQICGGDQQAIPTRTVPLRDGGCYGWSGATSGGLWQQVKNPGWRDPAIPWASTQKFDLMAALKAADVVVVGAGTNNALRNEDARFVGWDINNFRGAMKPRAKLIWLDVGVRAERVTPGVFASALAQDAAIWASARQGVCVVGWGGAVGAHPEYVQSDGVHLTAAGIDARWAAITRAVQTCQ